MLDQPFHLSVIGDDQQEAHIVLEPLRQGFGHTLGVVLRRVMLSSLPGAAITKVRIKGVEHQFTTLKGVAQDVVEFILNLKQLRISYIGEQPEIAKIAAVGPGTVCAKDIEVPATIRIANPDLVLATLADKKSKLTAELTIESGYGYLSAEEQGRQRVGVIPLDASFSPIREVSYVIEKTRVGRRTDYDKLILSVVTDGTITPSQAVTQAAHIAIDHFQQIISPVGSPTDDGVTIASPADAAILKLSVEELDLPTRIANALRNGGYPTVGDVVRTASDELSRVKNIGQKSIAEILKSIRSKGIKIEK